MGDESDGRALLPTIPASRPALRLTMGYQVSVAVGLR
jgi:hypothetical protein